MPYKLPDCFKFSWFSKKWARCSKTKFSCCNKLTSILSLPLILLLISLGVVILSIALGIVVQHHDSKWNDELSHNNLFERIRIETIKNGKETFTGKDLEIFYRDTWIKKAFLIISSFLLLSTIIHIVIYVLYAEEQYRYNFTIIFAILGILLYLGAGVFMMTSTIINSDNYDRINDLALENHLLENATILPLFKTCVHDHKELIHDEEIQVSDQVQAERKKIEQVGICQLSSIKIAAGSFAILNMFILGGVILTTHSKESKEDVELNNKRDLEFDENDSIYTTRVIVPGLYIQGQARRRAELENIGLEKLVEKPSITIDELLPEILTLGIDDEEVGGNIIKEQDTKSNKEIEQ